MYVCVLVGGGGGGAGGVHPEQADVQKMLFT